MSDESSGYSPPPGSLLKALGNDSAWERWKLDNGSSIDLRRTDLSGLNLSGKDLTGLNLSGSNLRQAKLCGANLHNVNLTDADLEGADLSNATLGGAVLLRTNLASTTLNRSDFRQTGIDFLTFQQATRDSASWGFGIYGIGAAGIEWYYGNVFAASTYLVEANMSRSKMRDTLLTGANLTGASLQDAELRGVDLSRSTLEDCSLVGAVLNNVDLEFARLINTNLSSATLAKCYVYGISCWDARTDEHTKQEELIVQRNPLLTVPTLDIAQFLYLLLNNRNIRQVIDTLTTKLVLILGRFSPERKKILELFRLAFRHSDYVPIIFDFEGPQNRDTQETVTTLARLSRAVIADISEPRSVPQELSAIVESLPSVTVLPILQQGCEPWGMYDHIRKYPWVRPVRFYSCTPPDLQDIFVDEIVASIDEI